MEPTLIAVITPHKPGQVRDALLSECIASVKAQTIDCDHIIYTDTHKLGPSILRNEMVKTLPAEYDWLAFLDDDDLFLPNHLAALSAVSENADVVYSSCQPGIATVILPFDREALRRGNYIAVTSLVRRSMFEKVGGFPDLKKYEDWRLWNNIADAGGRFVFVPEVTWTYRIQRDSRNFS